jgi:hypothetical protein
MKSNDTDSFIMARRLIRYLTSARECLERKEIVWREKRKKKIYIQYLRYRYLSTENGLFAKNQTGRW